MKKILIIILSLIITTIIIFHKKSEKQSGFYLLKPANTNIFTAKKEVENLNLPFSGKIKGGLFLRGENSEIEIDGKRLKINGKFLYFFPEEKEAKIQIIKGKIFAFVSPNFKLKPLYLKREEKFKEETFVRIFVKKDDNFFEVKEKITKSLEISPNEKIIIQDKFNSEDWDKKYDFLKNYSYIKINKTAYEAHYLPSKFTSLKIKIKVKRGMRVSFYAGSLNSFNESDFFDKIGDGTVFSILLKSKTGEKKIFEKRITNAVKYFDIEIPENGDTLILKASKGKNTIGDISFWGAPYLYTPQKERKLIILISLDTVRAESLSLYKKGLKTSPFLKKWAASDCLYYTNAYTTHPWTTEAHRSVFFSTYSWDKKELSVAELLQKKGFYTIALTGGNLVSSGLGFARGFTSYLDDNFNLFNREAGKVLYNRAKTYIELNKGKNTFLFLHTYQAHSPYMPPQKYAILGAEGVVDMFSMTKGVRGTFSPLPEEIRKKAKILYEEEILAIDQEFLKPLVNYLKGNNYYDKTMIIIFGDHGEQFYEHGSWEHGYSLYQEEVRVPLIVKDFNKKERGEKTSPISLKKIPLIITKALKLKPYKNWDNKKEDFIIFSTSPEYSLLSFPFRIGVLKDGYKLIYNVKIDKRKFENPPNLPKYEMYDLKKDPNEKHNVVYKNRKEFKELKRILNFYYKKAASQRRKNLEKIKKNLKSLGYVD